MIGYYIHHQGSGHLVRARSICRELTQPVIALSSLAPGDDDGFAGAVRLPYDNLAREARDPTASGALHWVPRQDSGLAQRMARIATWIAETRPRALVADVSVEVALLARLHGVPVISMVLPGARTDAPHRLVHQISDALVAAWPRELYDPGWLHPYRAKTHYVGNISRFAGRAPVTGRDADRRPTILVLAGTGGTAFSVPDVRSCAEHYPEYRWCSAGLAGWLADPWPQLCAADVVVAHAGQGAVADIAAAGKPAILIPAERPFGEQHAMAHALAAAGAAVVIAQWPGLAAWPALLDQARALNPARRQCIRTPGAAALAAAAITSVAELAPVTAS